MNLYLDASALVKRYVAEDGTETVREAMARADGWFSCRIGFVETLRAVDLVAGPAAARNVRAEWPAFGIVEIDQALCERSVELAVKHGLRSLDALHLAAALVVADENLVVATWDRRLHTAAAGEALTLVPATLH